MKVFMENGKLVIDLEGRALYQGTAEWESFCGMREFLQLHKIEHVITHGEFHYKLDMWRRLKEAWRIILTGK